MKIGNEVKEIWTLTQNALLELVETYQVYV